MIATADCRLVALNADNGELDWSRQTCDPDAGYSISDGHTKVYFSGDTGYHSVYQDLGRRYGPFDLGMVPIGAYKRASNLKSTHTTPEEAVRLGRDLGAKTLVFPTPVWIVGTYDKDGRPNGMTAAWGGICCSKPPCVYVALQKPRYSYANIVERQAYTLNVPSEKFVREARAAAQLKHANIVSVYSVGHERGVHYYAMELIEGQSLAVKEETPQQGSGRR